MELLPERIDLISLILQFAGAGALVMQLAAPVIRISSARAAQIGSVGGAVAGSAVGLLFLLVEALR